MKVYLVPSGPSRFSLYSEAASPTPHDGPSETGTLWGRATAAFRRAVDEGEAEAAGGDAAVDPSRGRFRRFLTRKIAEAVAEQRLLWAIRHEGQATLVHPDSIPGELAVEIARGEFNADYLRHRRWAWIDGVIVVVTGPLFFFVPGPNVVSWYFTFRAVGHYFSMKGARRGLADGFFRPEPSAALTDVAQALDLPRGAREARVAAAADTLGLERLTAFVNRVADRRA